MDWTKAKTILIVALALTNAFLLGAYLMRGNGRTQVDQDIMRAILTDENIFLETELPKKPGRMAVLYVQPEITDPARVGEVLADQRTLPYGERTDEALLAAADAVLAGCGFLTENAVAAGPPVQAGSRTLIRYRDVFNEIPIEESYILCTLENGQVTDIDRKWYAPLALHDKKGAMMEPMEALMQLLPARNGEESLIIRQMELVYWINPEGLGAESPVGDTALPAWKIVDAEGRETYIPAFE
ncbi:MAG: hypothetical protein LBT26_12345 [Clostridiales Family XIII bacterium]|jgi:hypothetical protein|nr:hypothetical protein [Clostridiales Family XIII bacterium]